MRTITLRTLKMLQVRSNQMCMRISFFVSKTVRKIRASFFSMPKIQLKRVNHKLSRGLIDAPSTGRASEASSGPGKSLVQHGLVEKRQTSGIEKHCDFKLAVTLKSRPCRGTVLVLIRQIAA